MNSRRHSKWALKVLVSVVLLTFVLSQISLVDVGLLLAGMNPGYFFLGLSFGFLSFVILGSARWKWYLRDGFDLNVPYGYLLRTYWTGMFFGYFVPANVGWDVYRITKANQYAGLI